MEKSKLIIAQLNELLAINYYVEKIYLDALNEVENDYLKHFCRAMAFERSEFCRFIGAEIIQQGGKPKYPEHIKHKSNLIWSNLKYIICVNDNKALVDELVRIKTWSIQKYEDVMSAVDFPSQLSELLNKQKSILEKSLRSVKSKKYNFNQLRTAN
ncbi:DUF2383 domain-containing protein [Cognatitamlana onchidii]|uniref:DUF2383 domain-containing protein n=1 Tax=Cognatitamlana onchidii TaxID=2562860 RepID=UPI0010A6AC84|nr:DUF2383 domain-containing protein [Algibacter onchidii]